MNEQLMSQIRELIDLLKKNSLKEMKIKTEDLQIEIQNSTILEQPIPHELSVPVLSCTAQDPSDRYFYVTSPLVGTFYRSPAPSSPPFAENGDEVDARQTLCIVEAMKVMNEIVSEKKGRIVEFLVENGEMVDFGKALVKLEVVEDLSS